MQQKQIKIGNLSLGNDLPLVLIGGINVLESKELALESCAHYCQLCQQLGIGYIFKASFDKANRSAADSFRGPGLARGLGMLAEVRRQYQVPVLTDVHEPEQAGAVAEVADVLQLPAFLSRQTDLVRALAQTGKAVNIKKAQFLAPEDMANIIDKFEQYGNNQLLLCERGTCFGYHNLVVDMLGFQVMRQLAYPLVFDVTHSLQLPGGLGHAASGRRDYTLPLARSGVAQKIAALFVEAHPQPQQAKCDGPSALPLSQLRLLLEQVQAIDNVVKSIS